MYNISEIIGHKDEGDKRLFQVVWEGYEQETPTWEPAAHMPDNIVYHAYLSAHGVDSP